MNIGNKERFHELAHKVLAEEAQPTEQSELRALIAENAELKEEFEQIGAQSAAAREILPLLEDLQHSHGRIPPPPTQRLQKAVCKVFERRPESPGEVRELLAKLESWAGRKMGAEREHLMHLISSVRQSISAPSGEAFPEAAMLQTPVARYASTRQLGEEAESRKARESEVAAKKRDLEFEDRLRSLEARLRQAEQIAHECRQEMRGLIEAFEGVREVTEKEKRAGTSD